MDNVTFKNVVDAVAQITGIPYGSVMSPAWKRESVRARHLAMYIMKEYLAGANPLAISTFFSCEAASVGYGVRMIRKHLRMDTDLRGQELNIKSLLKLQERIKCRPRKVNSTPVTKALKR